MQITLHNSHCFPEFIQCLCQMLTCIRNVFLIDSYVEEFPGLVHFIFVDRMSHQMTAPSINISSEDTDRITAYVKEEVRSEKRTLLVESV